MKDLTINDQKHTVEPYGKTAIIGAGAWGTTLAGLLAENETPAVLWAREEEVVRDINTSHENIKYLRGIRLSPRIVASGSLEEALEGAELVILASPSEHMAPMASMIAMLLKGKPVVLCVTKGLEAGTCMTMTDVIAREFDRVASLGRDYAHDSLAALSGPNLAGEIARRVPSSTVVASRNLLTAKRIQVTLMRNYFRVYTNTDIAGVQLGGALKNIISIAAGISDGLGFGANTKASLLTRGLAEMLRLAKAFGSRRETFMGLSGLGDLMATAMSELSRNRNFGFRVASGQDPAEILKESVAVVEGVKVVRQVVEFGRRRNIDLPICETVMAIVFNGLNPLVAVKALMTRKPKEED